MSQGRIIYLTTVRHRYTLKRWFDPSPGAEDPEVVQVAYQDLASWDDVELPTGTYVFGDVDRMPARMMRRAVALAHRIVDTGGARRVANWPNRVLNRVELLVALQHLGINQFGCTRYESHRPIRRFPVFLRTPSHTGPATDLIRNMQELARGIEQLLQDGARREDILIIEFQETDRFKDCYLTYGAFCAFGEVFPVDVAAARNWVAKYNVRIYDEDILHFEADWIRRNPHADQIAAVFRHARIDWGRIDFGLHRDKIQVFEINTNPDLIADTTWQNETRRATHLLPTELPNIRAAFRQLAAMSLQSQVAQTGTSRPATARRQGVPTGSPSA